MPAQRLRRLASDTPLSTQTNSTATFLRAVAGLVVVHRAILAGLFAALWRRFGRKRARANRCRQNRTENFRVRLHALSLHRETSIKQAENPWTARLEYLERQNPTPE